MKQVKCNEDAILAILATVFIIIETLVVLMVLHDFNII